MTGAEYVHFLRCGELHPEYVAYLTQKAMQRTKAHGVHNGTVKPKDEIVLDYEGRKAAAEFELRLINGMIDSIGEMTQKMLAKKR